MTEKNLSRLGLGCSRMGSFNNPQPLTESIALIRTALDMGVTVFDTSNIYGQGDSERAIGKALAGRRDSTFVITKTGRSFSAKMRMMSWLKPIIRPLLASRGAGASIVTARRKDALQAHWDAALFAASLDASLRRLRTDYVDGFLLHSPPAQAVLQPQIGEQLRLLKQSGKVRHFGVSCDDIATLEAALSIEGLSIVQLPWDVIAGAEHLAASIKSRGIIVLAREIIRLQPDLSPLDAVRSSVSNPMVSCTLVGTTKAQNLSALMDGLPPKASA